MLAVFGCAFGTFICEYLRGSISSPAPLLFFESYETSDADFCKCHRNVLNLCTSRFVYGRQIAPKDNPDRFGASQICSRYIAETL